MSERFRKMTDRETPIELANRIMKPDHEDRPDSLIRQATKAALVENLLRMRQIERMQVKREG